MSMDRSGRRATQLAKVGVEIAMAAATIGGAWALWALGGFMLGVGFGPRTMIPAIVALLLLGLWWLRAFLRDVLAEQVFTLVNARRLRKIGWLLIGVSLAKFAIPLVMPGVFGGGVGWMLLREPRFLIPMAIGLLTDSYLLAGLLLLVIASAWRYGAELQQERDFTV